MIRKDNIETVSISTPNLFQGRALLYFLKTIARIRPLWWAFLDVIISLVALKLAYDYAPKALGKHILLLQIYFFPLIILVFGNITGLYDRETTLSLSRIFISLAGMTIFSVVSLALFTNLVIYEQIGRYVLAGTGLVIFFGSGSIRIMGYITAKLFKVRVILIGNQETISELSGQLEKRNNHYQLLGFCHDEKTDSESFLGDFDDIPKVCADRKVDLIVIGTDYVRNPHVLDQCFKAVQIGCNIVDECIFFEHSFEMVLVDKIDPSWFYSCKLVAHHDIQAIMKRGMDIAIGLVGLILSAPLFPFIWLAVKIGSAGPVFYTQVRSGQFGKPFKIFKFRTMTVDAETNGAAWAKTGDSRIKPLGYILRKLRLDEIPQFWNILRGEMSIVGPRPERPELADKIESEVPFFSYRNWAKPGLTGLAQIRYRYGASIEDAKTKLQYDLFYIKNWTLILDLQIILRTFTAIMKGSR